MIVTTACAREGTCARPGDRARGAIVGVGSAGADDDEDGLDDNLEDALAAAYLPFLAGHPHDACPRSGLVFRARPHPDDAALVLVTYSRLYELDCGADGHPGDNEAFGVAIDPRIPPPAGILSIVAVSHQGTACERTTVCGQGDLPPCDTDDGSVAGRPVVYASQDKHAGSVSLVGGCGPGSCLDRCALPVVADDPPRVNAGEPAHPLVRDLTTHGFITRGNGWRSLFHADPWGDGDFGHAGNVRGDLVDDAFVAPIPRCE